MQQLIDVQTVIKSAALISAMGEIGVPEAWLKRRGEEGDEAMEERNGVMDVGGIEDEQSWKGRDGALKGWNESVLGEEIKAQVL